MRFRHQRAVVEAAPDVPLSERDPEEPGLSEQIEVHVHLHQAGRRSPPMPVQPPAFTGVLYDWDWYEARLSRQPTLAAGRRRRLMRGVLALLGLGLVAGIVVMGDHLLATSSAQTPTPTRIGILSGN